MQLYNERSDYKCRDTRAEAFIITSRFISR